MCVKPIRNDLLRREAQGAGRVTIPERTRSLPNNLQVRRTIRRNNAKAGGGGGGAVKGE